MAKVPTLDQSAVELNPTPQNAKIAGWKGEEVQSLAKEFSNINDAIQKMQTQKQINQARIMIGNQHLKNYQTASNAPNNDDLLQNITNETQQTLQNAADLIKDPAERDKFYSEGMVSVDNQMIPIQSIIAKRTSKDVKETYNDSIDQLLQQRANSADPEQRNMLADQMYTMAKEHNDKGLVHGEMAYARVRTAIEGADLKQLSAESRDADLAPNVYQQLQKGDDGMYRDVSHSNRVKYMDVAKKTIQKNGSDMRLIYATAQNHTESLLIDKAASNTLTAQDVVDARTGKMGVPISQGFGDAAMAMIDEPFPNQISSEVFNKLTQEATTTTDPLSTKIKIMSAREITPDMKSKLIDTVLKESSDTLQSQIDNGIKKNKQDILEENIQIQKKLRDSQNFLGKALTFWKDSIGWHKNEDQDKLSSMTQDYFEKLNDERMKEKQQGLPIDADLPNKIAHEVMNSQTLKDYPQIASFPKEGKVLSDGKGNNIRFFPDGNTLVEGVDE